MHRFLTILPGLLFALCVFLMSACSTNDETIDEVIDEADQVLDEAAEALDDLEDQADEVLEETDNGDG